MSEKKLNSRQMKFITNYVSGMSRAEAYHAVYNTKSLESARKSAYQLIQTNTDIQAEIERRLEEIQNQNREKLCKEAEESIKVLISLRDGAESDTVRYNAAREIMYMAGYKPTDKVDMSQHGSLEINIIAPEGVDIDKLN